MTFDSRPLVLYGRPSALLEILSPGPLTTVQDLGRPGWAHIGVPGSGAADQRALTLANRLVGNPEGAAALETTYGGLKLRLHAKSSGSQPSVRYIALTGAPCPARLDDGRLIAPNAPVAVYDGQVLELGLPSSGLRTYLAVRGGIDVTPSLGSRSTDLLSGLGPPPITAGDVLALGAPEGGLPGVDVAPQPPLSDDITLRVVAGPRDDWFTDESVQTLYAHDWEATSRSNRIGIRFDGPALTRRKEGELPAEGMARGALQVPPNGLPVLFLAAHPVTGGYPVVGVVHTKDLPLAGQIRPGARVRFLPARH